MHAGNPNPDETDELQGGTGLGTEYHLASLPYSVHPKTPLDFPERHRRHGRHSKALIENVGSETELHDVRNMARQVPVTFAT